MSESSNLLSNEARTRGEAQDRCMHAWIGRNLREDRQEDVLIRNSQKKGSGRKGSEGQVVVREKQRSRDEVTGRDKTAGMRDKEGDV